MIRRGVRQIVVLTVAIALSGVAAVAAVGADAFRQPCAAMKMQHDCGGLSIKACCCGASQSDQSLPASTPASATFAGQAGSPAPVFLSMPSLDVPPAASRVHSPPHGYRSADLSVLLSVFLI